MPGRVSRWAARIFPRIAQERGPCESGGAVEVDIYNPRMFRSLQALAERAVMERVTLLLNHVIGAEPVAVARLRPHAGSSVQVEFAGWLTLLLFVATFIPVPITPLEGGTGPKPEELIPAVIWFGR